MIIIVIGQSGAGKTTFVKEHYLKTPYVFDKDQLPFTFVEKTRTYLLGHYRGLKRCEGTDELSYTAHDTIIWFIKKYYDKGNIILEGDRITQQKIMDFIINSKYKVQLLLLECSVSTSEKRLKKTNSFNSTKWIKSTKTKSKNLFNKYKNLVKSYKISNE